MIYKNFWRSRLSADEQRDYDLIASMIERKTNSPNSSPAASDETRMNRIIAAVYNDNPEFYYTISMFPPTYFSVDNAAFEKAVRRVCAYVNGFKDPDKNKDAYKKILALKDYFASSVKYDYDILKEIRKKGMQRVAAEMQTSRVEAGHSFTAYGALVNKRAVCQGIAYAAAIILGRLKIPCAVVFGTLDRVEHSWNVVQIGDNNYHLDITSDLCREEFYYRNTYNYFLLTDEEIRKTHKFSELIVVSGFDCNADDNNYFVNSGLVFDDINDLRKYVFNGSYRDTLAFKYTGSCSRDYIQKLLEDAAMRRCADGCNVPAYSIVQRDRNGRRLPSPMDNGQYFAAFKATNERPKLKETVI